MTYFFGLLAFRPHLAAGHSYWFKHLTAFACCAWDLSEMFLLKAGSFDLIWMTRSIVLHSYTYKNCFNLYSFKICRKQVDELVNRCKRPIIVIYYIYTILICYKCRQIFIFCGQSSVSSTSFVELINSMSLQQVRFPLD